MSEQEIQGRSREKLLADWKAEHPDPVVTAHVSPDASPETLQAIAKAAQAAIDAIKHGDIAPAAQPAPGRVIGVDAYEKLLDKALALEAERDALRSQLEQQKRDCEETTRMHLTHKQRELDAALSERDALREKAALADKARAFMANRTIGGDAYHFWTVWFADYEALNAAQKAPA